MEEIKKNIIDRYGTEPTICYYYYLWNAVDYVGEKQVRKSFESISSQGNEIILGNYNCNDGTDEIAEEYGFKVLNVKETKDIMLHESKIVNAIVKDTEYNFLCDLSIHVIYPKNMDVVFKEWLKTTDLTKKVLATRGLFCNHNNIIKRKYCASCYIYKPYLIEARGYDERTTYGFGTTHYALCLLERVYGLILDNVELDMLHNYHTSEKLKRLKWVFKIPNVNKTHFEAMNFVDNLIAPLTWNFYEGVKNVKNSYW